MQCISCGKTLTEQDHICPKCGKPQPLAESKKVTKRPTLKSLSAIFLLIGLILLPLGLAGIVFLILISMFEKISILKLTIGIINIVLVTLIPFLLTIIFKKVK